MSTTAIAGPVPLTNAGFEAPIAAPYVYGPTGAGIGWTFGGNAGVSRNGTAWGGTAYEGTQFAFLQAVLHGDPFGFISQVFTLASADSVTLDFQMALRGGYNPGQQIAVYVDGIQIGSSFAATSTSWTTVSVALGALGAGNHTLALVGLADLSTFGDTSAFIDAVALNTTTPTRVPEPATGALLLGALGIAGFALRRGRKG
jgi:hypothetical protein